MKMSELLETAKTIREKQSERETAAALQEVGKEEGHLSICDDGGTYVEFDAGTPEYEALASMLRKRVADIEDEIRALGVEVDVPAIEPDEDDEGEDLAA